LQNKSNDKIEDLVNIQTILEETPPFITHVDTTEYTAVKDYIDRLVNNSEFLCRNINSGYILQSFLESDAVIVIGSENILPNGNIFGFALINFNPTHIYIDVICSHVGISGSGDILMNNIKNICQPLSMTKIKLQSVNSAIGFYAKYGFVKTESLCTNMCEMVYTVTTGGKRKMKRRKTKRRQTKRRKTKRRMRRA
jgi:hypothetical protein